MVGFQVNLCSNSEVNHFYDSCLWVDENVGAINVLVNNALLMNLMNSLKNRDCDLQERGQAFAVAVGAREAELWTPSADGAHSDWCVLDCGKGRCGSQMQKQ